MTATFDALAVRYMSRLIEDFDLTDFQAAGIVGNGGTESGGFTKIQEISPTAGRGGLGHFQWTGPRRVAFEEWLSRNADKGWTAETFEANYSMLWREIYEGGPEHPALVAISKTTSLEDATKAFMEKFERPGVPNLGDRYSWARKALAAFQAAGSPVSKPDVATPIALPPAAQLPPVQTSLNIQQFLPLVMMALSVIQKKRQERGEPTDLMQIISDLIVTMTQPPAPAPVAAPPVDKPQTAGSAITRPSVQLSALAGVATAAMQLFGVISPPIGETSTAVGTLATFAPVASALLGATGVWGTVAKVGLSLVGAIASAKK